MFFRCKAVSCIPLSIRSGRLRYLDNLLAPPVYTRPVEFNGWKVPDILLSGDDRKIEIWKMEQALERTKRLRPDLLEDN
jgi:tRNA (guanine37-N1)-methyltransferase